MFCLGCGTELRPHAEACSVCGRRVSDGPLTIAPNTGRLPFAPIGAQVGAQAAPASPAPLTPRAAIPPPAAPSIAYGDIERLGLPRDQPGRWVLIISLLLAADLYIPWVGFPDAHIAPSQFGTPAVIAAALLLAAGASVIYAPLRQRPYYAAFPMVLGAAALGAGGVLWLLLGPFASPLTEALVAHALANPALERFVIQDASVASGLIPVPDAGLYAFVLGSAILTIAGYRLFVEAVAVTVSPRPRPIAEDAARAIGEAPDEDDAGSPLAAGGAAGIAPSAPPAGPALAEGPSRGASDGWPGIALPGTASWERASERPIIPRKGPAMRGPGGRVGPRE